LAAALHVGCASFEPTDELPARPGDPAAGAGGSAAAAGGGTPSPGSGAGGASGGAAGSRPAAVDGGGPAGAAGASGGRGGAPGADAGAAATPPPPAGGVLMPFDRPHPSNYVFDETKVRTYSLTVAPDVMASLQRALAELRDRSNGFDDIARRFEMTWYPAVLKVDDEMFGKVTFRHKGSYGTLILCLRRPDCKKLSIKIKFDNPDTPNTEERLYGLKKINLHSQVADGSHVKERLAYGLFQEMGIVVPRSVHGRVYVNGELKGLYGVTEAPDGRFIDRLFVKGAANGNLYKEVWPSEPDAALWKARRETNEDDPMATDAKALMMSAAIRGAMSTPAELPKVLDSWLGLDYFFRMWAVDRVINNWDGPVTFYCGATVTDLARCRNHNFFLYEQEGANRFWLIPWDLDNTFHLRARQEDVGPWDKAVDCSSLSVLFQLDPGTKLKPAQCDAVFRGIKQAGAGPFAAALRRFLEGPFQIAKMNRSIDTWAAQIGEFVRNDPIGPGHAVWMGNLTTLKRDLQTLRDRWRAFAGVN
jgi:spore coat protein CotH